MSKCYACKNPSKDTSVFCGKCTERERLSQLRRWRTRRLRMIEYLGGQCVDCGLSSGCESVYDFHHRNPKEKELDINRVMKVSWEKCLKELVKCDLLCANCHRIRHWKERETI